MVTGFNHLTLCVNDLKRSLTFYVDVLGFKSEGRWDNGAYLSAGEFWLCLALEATKPAGDDTHYAFSIDESAFDSAVARIIAAESTAWKVNTSEGRSYYFLDPDGHKLELHCGRLHDRLASIRENPYSGWQNP